MTKTNAWTRFRAFAFTLIRLLTGKGRSQIYKIPVSATRFNAVRANQMLFQVCQDDERLTIGDPVLEEIDDSGALTGAIIACAVTYKHVGGLLGLKTGYCVLGLYKTGAISPFVVASKNQCQC